MCLKNISPMYHEITKHSNKTFSCNIEVKSCSYIGQNSIYIIQNTHN